MVWNEILQGNYSKQTKDFVIEYLISNPHEIKNLFNYLTHKNQHIGNYAGWIISYLAEYNNKLIQPHISILVKVFDTKDNNPALIRNTFRTLQFLNIPKQHDGLILSKGFESLNNSNSAVAIKVFAMTVIYNLSLKYPEIQPELKLSLENQFEQQSAGFKSRALKILKRIKK